MSLFNWIFQSVFRAVCVIVFVAFAMTVLNVVSPNVWGRIVLAGVYIYAVYLCGMVIFLKFIADDEDIQVIMLVSDDDEQEDELDDEDEAEGDGGDEQPSDGPGGGGAR